MMLQRQSSNATPSSKGTNGTLAAGRMGQLRDKMVLKVVQTHKKKYPQCSIDPKSIDTVRQQLGMMLENGPVGSKDLARLGQMLKSEERPSKSTMQSQGRKTADQDTLAAFAATFGSSMQKKEALDPKSSTLDVSQMAQEVRALPPLVQRRMVVKTLQKPWMERMGKELEEHGKMLEAQKQRKHQMKEEQRQFLDAQVARRQEQKGVEKERAQILALEEANQREIWKGEADLSARRRKEEIHNVMGDLKNQREMALQRKQAEAERRRKDEAEKVRRLQEELRQEEEEKQRKREALKEQIQGYLVYNQGMKAASDLEKKRLQEQDILLLRQYEAKLEQQERDREEGLKKVSERQAKQYELAEGVQKGIQELADRDERKARKEQEEMERKTRTEEERRKNRVIADREKTKAVVAAQIAEKELAKKRAQEEANRLREEVARSVAVAEEKERIRKEQQKQFALQGLRDVDKQLVEQHQRRFKPQPIKVGEA